MRELVDALPIIGNIGQQYVWAGVSIFFTLLVPFGMHALLRGGPRKAALGVRRRRHRFRACLYDGDLSA